MNDNRFYVYALLDPRKPGKYKYEEICFLYEPFYIGKGTGNRINAHSSPSELNRDRNPHKKRKIKKILKEKLEVIRFKIKDGLMETVALALERDYILNIGYHNNRTGPLTNMDEGGANGPLMTKELKLKISTIKKKQYSSGELIHPWVGRKHT